MTDFSDRSLFKTIDHQAAEIERLRKGIRDCIEGNYGPRTKKTEKCPHGLYGYETCENCIDEHLIKLLYPGTLKEEPK